VEEQQVARTLFWVDLKVTFSRKIQTGLKPNGLSSFLRSLLPAVSRNFPDWPIVGLSTTAIGYMNLRQLGYGLELDDCLMGAPRPEDLIVQFPHIAAKYSCDTGSLRRPDTQSLAG
jgi:hypothetical protein